MASHRENQVEASVQAWLEVFEHLTYYELLGVAADASSPTLSQAFHRFAQSFHPDQHRNRSEALRRDVSRIFRRGAEAYRVLGDTRLRSEYNLSLARRSSPTLSGGRAQSLVDLCATPGGRLHARQAERAIAEGQLPGAYELVERALVAEGPNAELEQRLLALANAIELGSGSQE